jgi:hypothetical protein
MTNMDCGELLAHHHIPFGTHVKDIEWLFSSHLGVMADNKLASG